MPLLTIIIPTYNRANFLDKLLKVLSIELFEARGDVVLLIGDNASSDGTEAICVSAALKFPTLQYLRHPSNLGPDENFARCVEKVKTQYFWLIGDDDIPVKGAVPRILELLSTQRPDLLYLKNKWVTDIHDRPLESIQNLNYSTMDRLAFAKKINVWFTFVSGLIVNMETYAETEQNIRKFSGTSLIQLGWVFAVLRHGKKFYYINDVCVLATSGNSGNYGVIKVFGVNFPQIVDQAFDSRNPLRKAILNNHIIDFLPFLVWGLRFSHVGAFEKIFSTKDVHAQLSSYFAYWILVYPIMNFSKLMAFPFYLLAKLIQLFRRKILGYA